MNAIGLDVDGYHGLDDDGRNAIDAWCKSTGVGDMLDPWQLAQVELLDESGRTIRVTRIDNEAIARRDATTYHIIHPTVVVLHPFPLAYARPVTPAFEAYEARVVDL